MSIDITDLLKYSVGNNASDLHLSAGLMPMIRIDGDMRKLELEPMQHKEVFKLVYDIMNDQQRKELEDNLEVDFSFALPGVARFRVNVFHQNRGIGAVFRTIPSKVLTLEDLKCPPIFKKISEAPRGLVLVTGPTGSGKSTTLAAMIDYVNESFHEHILTIEDPIEFTHKSQRSVIAQREVHYDTFSFAAALRSVLREDPDVVLIGEMRDLETIQAAITIAETGHLVFATLHTNSAAQSIDRMVDVFPSHQQPQVRTQLANMLMAICAQRLVPAIGGGRVVAAEIMINNSAIRSLIREGKTHQIDTAIQTGADQGMQTMDRTLAKLIQTGVITYESAQEYAVDINELNRLVRG